MANTKIKTRKAIIVGLMTIVFSLSFFSFAQASMITPEKVVDLVNKERIKQGLSALILNATLNQAAEYKAKDMLKNDYFAHTSPAGLTPWHWMEKSGYDYKYAGENLAVGFESAEKQQEAWMKSETHRKNILGANYRDIGVAVKEGKINGENILLTVQVFGAPRLVPVTKGEDSSAFNPEQKTAILPAEVANPEVVQTNDFVGQKQPAEEIKKEGVPVFSKSGKLLEAFRYADELKNKFIESNWGTYTMAAALAGIGYLTALNFMILAYLVIESKRKNLQNDKYQILYTVSAEEYEDLMRSFKTRARGMYKAHFDKIHLKMTS